MESTTQNAGPGQRSLAAIVFTDVVSFSARMQTDEETTLRLLQRDFAAMRTVCAEHHGSVLKTTGDGLLLYFSSAVQAVACALAMQRLFAELAKAQPAAETLTHRVGIHLGDVFVNNQDVMGDGVNIAARLQAEAQPGGICISQTVYDVVKNKLTLHATKLGPRELKNISQAIPIYRLLLEAQSLEALEAGPLLEEPPAPVTLPSRPLTKVQKLTIAGVLALALIITASLVTRSILQQKKEQTKTEATQAAITSLLENDTDAAGKNNREKMPRVLAEWREELRDSRSRAPGEYDFSEMARLQRETRGGAAAKADGPQRLMAAERMKVLFVWMNAAMQRYNKDHPLTVTELSGTAPMEIKVFAGADRQLYYAEGGAIRQRNWTDLKPAMLGAIFAGVLQDSPVVPPREVVQGAQIFAHFYNLPEMTEALHKGHLRRNQK
jgi:class 3 adenylate cyclase